MDKNEKQSNNKGIIMGAVIGGASVLALALNKKARATVIKGAKQAITQINHTTSFIADNREEILTQIKNASNEFSHLLKTANQDIQVISEKAGHLRNITKSVKDTTQQTASELRDMKKQTNSSEEPSVSHEE